ncbi:MAG: HAD family hydrolase [Selenomonadaceae bacterium]|nr:HAD family hydrolase [Selenomonadaceae bacterium]
MIKLFVTDIDGTLLPTGGKVSEKNIEAIQKMTQAGVKVVIATGRMHGAALPIAAQLKVPVPIISYNGGLIKSSSGEVIHTQFMDEDIVLKIIDFFAERGRHIQSYSNDTLYVPERNSGVEYYEEAIRVKAVTVGWDGLRQRVKGVPKLLTISEDLNEILDSMNGIKKLYGDKVEATQSNIRFAEFMHKGVTKAGAIKILASKLGIANDEILTIGDSENDLPMLTAFDCGIAMGNAKDSIKAVCKHVTDICENDGFAKAAYDYVLKPLGN